MKKRLQTILAHAGVASRRRAALFIEEGRVKVDGVVVKEKGLNLCPEEHEISVNDKPVVLKERKYYFLLNKPGNVISTAIDTHDRKKVTDLIKHVRARLYPVGRLDKDTTGAIILTNDGPLTHRLTHPSFEVEKEYEATVSGDVTREEIARLERGVDIDGKDTSPCRIAMVERGGGTTVLRVKLHEGRKRQIRRMFEAIGKKVIELERIGYAGLTLGKLARGEYRELTPAEIRKLRELTGEN